MAVDRDGADDAAAAERPTLRVSIGSAAGTALFGLLPFLFLDLLGVERFWHLGSGMQAI